MYVFKMWEEDKVHRKNTYACRRRRPKLPTEVEIPNPNIQTVADVLTARSLVLVKSIHFFLILWLRL